MKHIRTSQAILVELGTNPEDREAPYDLETAAELSDVHPERIKHYCRLGLIQDVPDPDREKPLFNDHSLYELRRIEYLRRREGVSLRGIHIILSLLRETETLREALRFHRGT